MVDMLAKLRRDLKPIKITDDMRRAACFMESHILHTQERQGWDLEPHIKVQLIMYQIIARRAEKDPDRVLVAYRDERVLKTLVRRGVLQKEKLEDGQTKYSFAPGQGNVSNHILRALQHAWTQAQEYGKPVAPT